jgi:dTMP kinase
LERGEMVVCDRFYHASMAYQGYGRGIPLDFITRLTELVCDRFRPEVTILLDIEPAVGLARARARNHGRVEDEGRFEAEDLEFYARVRNGYLELAKKDPLIKVISADRPIGEVHRDIVKVLELER